MWPLQDPFEASNGGIDCQLDDDGWLHLAVLHWTCMSADTPQ